MTSAVINVLVFFSVLLISYLVWIVLFFRSRTQRQIDIDLQDDTYLVVYASQSGQVEAFAKKCYEQLNTAKKSVICIDIQDLNQDILLQAHQVIWMVSTYGEGDAPDTAQTFVQQYLEGGLVSQSLKLSHQKFAVFAFGDRAYPHFCGFGQSLYQWLIEQEAKALFDLVTIDQFSKDDLAHGFSQLSQVIEYPFILENSEKQWYSLELKERQHLNEGSLGQGLYHLKFKYPDNLTWQSGDILEFRCFNTDSMIEDFILSQPKLKDLDHSLFVHKNLRNIPQQSSGQSVLDWFASFTDLPLREYSIASIPAQGSLSLVIRQKQFEQSLGLGSGLLTQHIKIGETVEASIRKHQSFHLVASNKPLILIGNGSGIAGLMGHLQQRHVWGHQENWLIFGERQASVDRILNDEINSLKELGYLPACNLVFSRDGQRCKYVQDVLIQQATQLKEWVDAGAYIYVCGQLNGMGQGVDQALKDILGEQMLTKLRESKRYCRDLY